MIQSRRFRLQATLLSALVVGGVIFVAWDSADTFSSETTDILVLPEVADISSSEQSVIEQPVPDDFPAPAKKLHQFINDLNDETSNSLNVDEQVTQLNTQITAINEQLENQGIDVPQHQELPVSQSNTQARLKAIQDHMKKRQPAN
jgi:hypothetical protein